MPQPANRPRLRKREIVLAIGAGALAAGAAAGILSDDDGPSPPFVAVNQASEQTYELTNFERISSIGPQDVEIEFGETYSVRAEGAINGLEVVVEDGELVIRPRNNWDFGRMNSTTLFVTVPRLTRVFLNGTGNVSIDQLKGDRFAGVLEGFAGDLTIDGMEVDEAEFTIDGPGDITAAGTARATRVTVNGPGEFKSHGLRSQTATIRVNGPGDVQLAVEELADVTVAGPGEVDIDGPARCEISTTGPGSVSCGDQDTDD
jgi:hypothetical protein